jgi:hypothetical protein
MTIEREHPPGLADREGRYRSRLVDASCAGTRACHSVVRPGFAANTSLKKPTNGGTALGRSLTPVGSRALKRSAMRSGRGLR